MEGFFKTLIRIDDKYNSKGQLISVVSDADKNLYIKLSGYPGSYYYIHVTVGLLLTYLTGYLPTYKLIRNSEKILLEAKPMPLVRIKPEKVSLNDVPFAYETFPEVLNGINLEARIANMFSLISLNNKMLRP